MDKGTGRTSSPVIGIQPLGDIPDLVLTIVDAHIHEYLHLPSTVLPGMEVPDAAFNGHRLQFDAARILEVLSDSRLRPFRKLIAVCDVDLFLPIFSHVYGEAVQGGEVAVVSLFRLKSDGVCEVSPSLFYERTAKVALHEIGHLFDLVHCENKNCLMYFSGNLDHLNTIQLRFCRYCRLIFQRSVGLSDGVRKDRKK